VQGPNDPFVPPDGNAATSVVWNPVRQLLWRRCATTATISPPTHCVDRMAAQPGTNLMASAGYCPTNSGSTGSPACPIFRGTLAVNPQTGDTFAWTVDIDNQDQGLWQDLCAVSAGPVPAQRLPSASSGTRRRWRRTPRWARPPLKTATTTWRWRRCPPAGDDGAGRRQRPVAERLPRGAGLPVAQHHQLDHVHERAGGRVPARPGLEWK